MLACGGGARVRQDRAVQIFSIIFVTALPPRYLDGEKVWSWNKPAWILAAGLTDFMIWEILLNPERSSV